MDYEMESLIQALVIQINLIWNQFHGIIHEQIRYAHALDTSEKEFQWSPSTPENATNKG